MTEEREGGCRPHPGDSPPPPATAGGPQKQQEQSTLGAEQKVPSFWPVWVGNQGGPREEVARRGKGTSKLGTERAKASGWREAWEGGPDSTPQASPLLGKGAFAGGAGLSRARCPCGGSRGRERVL